MTSPRNAAPLVRRSVERADTLRPAAYNPRKISKEALKGLQASIERWGVVQDIVVNSRNRIVISGHQRLAALKAAGPGRWTACYRRVRLTARRAPSKRSDRPHGGAGCFFVPQQ